MWQELQEWAASVDWQAFMANFSNERMVELMTHPYGMAVLGVLAVISMVLKWRFVFASLVGITSVGFLVRATLADDISGPDRTLLAFAGGGVAIAAFVIYYLFIRED